MIVLWFTGLSGSGKTTIGELLLPGLKKEYNDNCLFLDGDILRTGLNSDLGFSKKDRMENIRRIRYLCYTLKDLNVAIVVTAITPYHEMRKANREVLGKNYVEVYLDVPLNECVNRDVKGLYKKALKGEIPEFTGVSDPFDIPMNSDIICNTLVETPEESRDKIFEYIKSHFGLNL